MNAMSPGESPASLTAVKNRQQRVTWSFSQTYLLPRDTVFLAIFPACSACLLCYAKEPFARHATAVCLLTNTIVVILCQCYQCNFSLLNFVGFFSMCRQGMCVFVSMDSVFCFCRIADFSGCVWVFFMDPGIISGVDLSCIFQQESIESVNSLKHFGSR